MVVFGVSPAPAAISVSPFRVYNDKIVISGPMAILRSFGRLFGDFLYEHVAAGWRHPG
jgi:hypothetical protein